MSETPSAAAERAVLAAFLLDPNSIRDTEGTISKDDFALDRHRLIYQAIQNVYDAGDPVDNRTVQAELEERGWLEKAGGMSYLVGLDMDLPDLSRVKTYVRLVVDAAVRRRLERDLRVAAQALTDGGEETTAVISLVDKAVRSATAEVAVDELLPVHEGMEAIIERIENPLRTSLTGIGTGYTELDRITGGFGVGEFIIVAARPGMGKTALASCFSLAASKAGVYGAFFSLEMRRQEIQNRFVAAESSVSFRKIESGHMTEFDKQTVRAHVQRFATFPLILHATHDLTIHRFAGLVRQAKREFGIGYAVLDYLGILRPDGKSENRNLEVSSWTRELKTLALDLEIPIIALHQLKRMQGKPVLSDLRDSGSIEQDADKVFLIYRQSKNEPLQEDAPPLDKAELIVAKQRNGDIGSFLLKNRLEFFRFDELQGDEAVQAQLGIRS